MKETVLETKDVYQLRYRNGGDSKRYSIWHPKSATVKYRSADKIDCLEYLDVLLGLNYFVATHPWKRRSKQQMKGVA